MVWNTVKSDIGFTGWTSSCVDLHLVSQVRQAFCQNSQVLLHSPFDLVGQCDASQACDSKGAAQSLTRLYSWPLGDM